MYKYFDYSEFDQPGRPGTGNNMNIDFMNMLDSTRHDAGIAFHVTSGFRDEKYNRTIGGSDNSAHLRGKAADIAATDSRTRWLIINAAIKNGFNRIGIGRTFIHLDSDKSLPQDVIWHYYD